MPEPLLAIEGMSAGYGDVQVLWGIDLAVESGEIACIVGPNGAGKTTLLRTLSGLCRPDRRPDRFQGEQVRSFSADEIIAPRHCACPGRPAAVRGLTVRDNLLLGAYLRRDKAEIRPTSITCSRSFPFCASGRVRTRLRCRAASSRCAPSGAGIMSRPKLLMIDELSLGLAPRLVERLSEALLEINRTGVTILLVEQDVLAAFELARHAFVIETGRVTLHGTTAALAENPSIRQAYLGM